MRTRPALAAALVVLLVPPGPVPAAPDAPAAEGAPIYGDPAPFGPAHVSFPWAAEWSPDGRWIAFSDGYTAYVEVWDVASNERAWPRDGKARSGTHRPAFSADSKRVAFVDGERLVVLALEGGGWKQADAVTLDAKPPISARVSPLRLDLAPSGTGAVFSTGDGANQVDLTCSCVEEVGDWKDVVATFAFPDSTIAVSREEAFSTRVLPPEGEPKDVPGVLLEADAAGTRWLVAPDKSRFDLGFLEQARDSRLALEIRDAAAGKSVATFELAGRRDPSKGSGHRLLLQAEFSPDGSLLATVEGTGCIVLRDAKTGAPRQRIVEYADAPYPMGVAFSPDGKRLLTGGRRPPGTKGGDVLMWARR
jgi:WD40 repeat protein